MNYVNMLEAKSSLSRLVEDVEMGRETEIIIARGGRPVARLVPLEPATPVEQRIGIARGAFDVPDNIDTHNNEVAALFRGDAG
jgi:antitoxin (DNA-binding transcriptional repressor) of toxin-antitoxin stability system